MATWQAGLKDDARRANIYRCEYCEHNGLHRDRQRRQCLRNYDTAILPVAREQQEGYALHQDNGEVEMNRDQVLDEFQRLRFLAPEKMLREIAREMCVCPTGLVDDEDWRMLELEGAVREYGAAMFAVYGYEDGVPARVLDGITVIRATRNQLDAKRWAKGN